MGSDKVASLASELNRLVAGRVLEEEPLAQHTTFGVGGPADLFYLPAGVDDLATALHLIRDADVPNAHTPIVADHLFEKDKLFAYINLNDEEVAIYDHYYRHFKGQLPTPDLVVYLKAPIHVLRERIGRKNIAEESHISDEYIDEVVRAYEHFFAHYKAADVLVVDTSKFDFVHKEEDLEELLEELSQPVQGTQYFLPLGS